MEQPEVEKSCTSSEDGGLARSRSFKSKQLVRSQAIRESTSPPRTVSPFAKDKDKHTEDISASERDNSDTSSHSDRCSVINNDRLCDKKQPVEIQITPGTWEHSQYSEQRTRARRWLGHRPHSDTSRDLLTHAPRRACVCGECSCPHCKGKRRKQTCPTKQDSGIVCSDDCPDCSESDGTSSCPNSNVGKKSGSFDADDQPTFYCRCPERKEKPKSYSLVGTDFVPFPEAEPTVPELVAFIKDTLNKNPRDRMTLLRIEKELHSLVNDNGRCVVRFPVMTSYGRMLVHRCAALFHLAHHLDHGGKNCVIVSKTGTSGGRIPCTPFRRWCTVVFPQSPRREERSADTAKSILKRSDTNNSAPAAAAGRSKSLEQRERDYEQVRRRIFSTDNCTHDESQWPWLSGPVKLLTPESGRNKLIKVQSLEGSAARARGPVAKSHSFGGYSEHAPPPPPPRLLSRQGDLASSSWRLSPSSSGYKTLSLRSTDSITPSPTGGASPEPGAGAGAGALLWAVTHVSAVPAGALVIHPQTGRPLTNPDGSLYHFDPDNPPLLYDASGYLLGGEHQEDLNNEKKRGKLEKQQSFIDNDCECQPTEECHTKCYCECRDTASVKNSPQKTKAASIPTSPVKNRYETKPITPEPKLKPKLENQIENHEPQKSEAHKEIPKTNETVKHEANVNVNKNTQTFESPTQRPIEPNQNQELESKKPYENQSFESTQHHFDSNQRPLDLNERSFDSNQRSRDSNQRSLDSNQRSFNSNQRSFDSNQRAFDSNQRSFNSNQGSFDSNQRSYDRYEKRFEQRVKEEAYQQNYVQGYRNEEITSPQATASYQQPDAGEMQGVMQAKMTPVPLQDPNIRPMSLTNVVYPTGVPPNAYPYVNACRIDQQLQGPMYQQMIQQNEEQKQMTSSPHNDNTFRIDPSYPYAADFSATCGTCDSNTMQQQRGYHLPYGQVEMPPGLVPQYSVPNVLVQQPIQPYPYQEQMVGWGGVPLGAAGKYVVQDVFPVLCPAAYPPYNVLYPQVIQQPYPIVQPIYPMMDKQSDLRRNLPRPKRNLSRQTDDGRHDEYKHADENNDIQMKIQQFKDQMSQLNTREKGRNEWRRRNSGNGILGSYPVNFNGSVVGGAPADDGRLSSAARAIVDSIRNLQVKNNCTEPRPLYPRRREDNRRPPAPLVRQMSPGTWCRRSPGPFPPGFNHPRRPHPDTRNGRR